AAIHLERWLSGRKQRFAKSSQQFLSLSAELITTLLTFSYKGFATFFKGWGILLNHPATTLLSASGCKIRLQLAFNAVIPLIQIRRECTNANN
ncbi:MAG: hypothetical protein WCL54_08395, partial [Clostridia bacterium]